MKAGSRNHLVTFQRATSSEDGYGAAVEAWGALTTAWAEWRWQSGAENRIAVQTGAVATATVIVPYCITLAGLTARDRLVHAGSYWNIVSVVPLELNEGIEITVTAQRD